jgi:hypothetical protein
MPSKDNVFINIIVDEHGKQATDAVTKRLMKVGQIVDQSTTKFKKNGQIWTEHSYILHTTAAEYDAFTKRLTKFQSQIGKLKTSNLKGISNVTLKQSQTNVQEKLAATQSRLNRTTDKSTQRILKNKIKRLQVEQKYWESLIKTRNTIYKNSYQYALKYDTQQRAFRENLYRNSMRYSTQYYAQERKEQEQGIRRNIEFQNAWARIKSAQARAVRIPTSDLNILLESVDPEVADGLHNTVRQVNRLYDTSDRLKRYSGTLHRISMGFLAINMSALGMYFSMFSVITLLRSGISSLFGPLSDIGGAFEQLAMSEAFGMGIGQNLDPEKIITAWERFTGLQADIQSMLLVLGTEVLTDPKVWDAVSSAMKSVFDTLAQPDTINAIKSLVIALANTLPIIVRELPGIANIVTTISPYLETLIPLAIKAAIAMPFLALATGVASFIGALVQGVVWIARFYASYKALGALGAISKTLGLGVEDITFFGGLPTNLLDKLKKFLGIGTTATPLLLGEIAVAATLAVTLYWVLTDDGVAEWWGSLGDKIRENLAANLGLDIIEAAGFWVIEYGAIILKHIASLEFDLISIDLERFKQKLWDNPIMKWLQENPVLDFVIRVGVSLIFPPAGGYDQLRSYFMGPTDLSGQYQSYATGGYISKSGFAYLHQGEYVSPKYEVASSDSQPSVTNNTFSINVYGTMTKEVNDDLINKLQNAITYGGGV